MSIEKMEFVNIAGLSKDLDTVLVKLSDCNCFHIEQASKFVGKETKFAAPKEENPYAPVLKKLSLLSAKCGVKYKPVDFADIDGISIEKVDRKITKIAAQINDLLERKKLAIEKLTEYTNALEQVEHLAGLDVDFQQIFSCKNVKLRFGKLPIDSYEKLPYYYDNKTFLYEKFSEEKEYYWGVYFTPVTNVEEVDEIFDSLYFERIHIADFVHGDSEDAASELHAFVDEKNSEISQIEDEIASLILTEQDGLDKIFSKFKARHDNFDLRNKAAVANDKFYIVGYIPHSELDRFLLMFEDLEGVSVITQPADANGKLSPPIKIKNNKFSAPFSLFVEMYGLPSYNGLNPTTFVAITYTLLFGIMFGDLGQGLLVALLGGILWKTKKFVLGPIMVRVGISSMIFGTLYGSIFGFEELLDPVYEKLGIPFLPFKPMHAATTVLVGAIAIGVFIILISILVNIIRGIKAKNFESALFSNNGVAGFIFYGAILGGAVGAFLKVQIFSLPYILGLIVLPFLVIFLREPLSHWVRGKKFDFEDGVGDFITTNVFEMVEFMLGYATNTLSFVRIGGFVLAHAGMMSVVMMLAETASGAGSPVVIIIGNLFVMGLEGLIVGIQVLRLEFYEIFSRFYDGDGRPFEPVSINYDDNIE